MRPLIALGRFAKWLGDARLMAGDIKTLERYRLFPTHSPPLCSFQPLDSALLQYSLSYFADL